MVEAYHMGSFKELEELARRIIKGHRGEHVPQTVSFSTFAEGNRDIQSYCANGYVGLLVDVGKDATLLHFPTDAGTVVPLLPLEHMQSEDYLRGLFTKLIRHGGVGISSKLVRTGTYDELFAYIHHDPEVNSERMKIKGLVYQAIAKPEAEALKQHLEEEHKGLRLKLVALKKDRISTPNQMQSLALDLNFSEASKTAEGTEARIRVEHPDYTLGIFRDTARTHTPNRIGATVQFNNRNASELAKSLAGKAGTGCRVKYLKESNAVQIESGWEDRGSVASLLATIITGREKMPKLEREIQKLLMEHRIADTSLVFLFGHNILSDSGGKTAEEKPKKIRNR